MNKGTLYGVGVGPGDPKLMTLRAVETIARCPVLAAPRTPGGRMTALEIAKGAVDLSGKTVVALDFAMSRDAERRSRSHIAAAAVLRGHLDRGFDVAMLNLGDVSLYASFQYLADILRREGYAIEMVAGVPSFCAAAATLGTSLTDMDTPLHIVPDSGNAEPAEPVPGAATVWLKSGANLRRLLARLEKEGLLGDAQIVQNCGMPGQRVIRDATAGDVEGKYFTVVILRHRNNGKGTT